MARLTLSIVLLCVAVASGIQKRSRYDPIDYHDCGKRPVLSDNGVGDIVRNGSSRVTRVVGGKESTPYSWPSLCSLRSKYVDGTHGPHECAGNLIKNLDGDYFFITAAHCTVDRLAEKYVAYCGLFDKLAVDKPNLFVAEMSHLYIHPDYDDWDLDNDIAIFKLANTPPTNDYIQPVCLPNELYNVEEKGIVAGWGASVYDGALNNKLREVVKPIKKSTVCKERYGSSVITARMFCAGLPEGGADFCKGDGGGGFFTYRFNRWTLAGIVSWGFGCGVAGEPGVYNNVVEMKPWINIIINHGGITPS